MNQTKHGEDDKRLSARPGASGLARTIESALTEPFLIERRQGEGNLIPNRGEIAGVVDDAGVSMAVSLLYRAMGDPNISLALTKDLHAFLQGMGRGEIGELDLGGAGGWGKK